MNVQWDRILAHLQKYPVGTHRLLPPCDEARIGAVEPALGRIPLTLVEMLKHFNGAELFNKTGPLVSIFGISTMPPLSPLEWASDWYIDIFTPRWRASAHASKDDWVIAMMNYGGLIILGNDGQTQEWDSSQQEWSCGRCELDRWIDELLRQGDAYLVE